MAKAIQHKNLNQTKTAKLAPGAKTKAKAAVVASAPAPTQAFAPAEVDSPGDSDVDGWEDETSDDENDEDDGGVDEAGMKRLMDALGEDGLDEHDLAQLQTLGSDADVTSDEDEEGEHEGEDVSDDGSEADTTPLTPVDLDAENDDLSAEGSGSDDGTGDEDGGDEDHDDAVPLDEVESVDEDAVPRQKIEIDNQVSSNGSVLCRSSSTMQIALRRIRDTIKLDASLPWTETLVVTYPEQLDVDVEDDLNREVALSVPLLTCMCISLG
jgi:rRNA-processing protein EBP2